MSRNPLTTGAFFKKGKKKKPWYAKITRKGITTFLGYYSSRELAANAYQQAKRQLEAPPARSTGVQGELF